MPSPDPYGSRTQDDLGQSGVHSSPVPSRPPKPIVQAMKAHDLQTSRTSTPQGLRARTPAAGSNAATPSHSRVTPSRGRGSFMDDEDTGTTDSFNSNASWNDRNSKAKRSIRYAALREDLQDLDFLHRNPYDPHFSATIVENLKRQFRGKTQGLSDDSRLSLRKLGLIVPDGLLGKNPNELRVDDVEEVESIDVPPVEVEAQIFLQQVWDEVYLSASRKVTCEDGFLGPCAQGIFHITFWFVFCAFFQVTKLGIFEDLMPKMGHYMRSLSLAELGKSHPKDATHAHRRFFLDHFHFLIAQGVIHAFFHMFRGSSHLFTENWGVRVFLLVGTLLTGSYATVQHIQETCAKLLPNIIREYHRRFREMDIAQEEAEMAKTAQQPAAVSLLPPPGFIPSTEEKEDASEGRVQTGPYAVSKEGAPMGEYPVVINYGKYDRDFNIFNTPIHNVATAHKANKKRQAKVAYRYNDVVEQPKQEPAVQKLRRQSTPPPATTADMFLNQNTRPWQPKEEGAVQEDLYSPRLHPMAIQMCMPLDQSRCTSRQSQSRSSSRSGLLSRSQSRASSPMPQQFRDGSSVSSGASSTSSKHLRKASPVTQSLPTLSDPILKTGARGRSPKSGLNASLAFFDDMDATVRVLEQSTADSNLLLASDGNLFDLTAISPKDVTLNASHGSRSSTPWGFAVDNSGEENPFEDTFGTPRSPEVVVKEIHGAKRSVYTMSPLMASVITRPVEFKQYDRHHRCTYDSLAETDAMENHRVLRAKSDAYMKHYAEEQTDLLRGHLEDRSKTHLETVQLSKHEEKCLQDKHVQSLTCAKILDDLHASKRLTSSQFMLQRQRLTQATNNFFKGTMVAENAKETATLVARRFTRLDKRLERSRAQERASAKKMQHIQAHGHSHGHTPNRLVLSVD